MKLATIINYSSLDNQFIEKAVREAKQFSHKVIVVSYSHFFDGTPDNKLLNISCDMQLRLQFTKGHQTRFYHNNCRYEGYQQAEMMGCDAFLFLDGDEVPIAEEFKAHFPTLNENAKLLNFWYIKDTTLQAKQWEDSATLLLGKIDKERFFHDSERHYLSEKWLRAFGERPLIHHYSWAKDKKTLLKKVKTWGHKDDNIDWIALVNHITSDEFTVDSIVPFNGYTLQKVTSFI